MNQVRVKYGVWTRPKTVDLDQSQNEITVLYLQKNSDVKISDTLDQISDNLDNLL